MPESRDRKARDRDADLAGIDALIDRLVPALAARLATTHLAELEIREGQWRIRLRRPPGAGWGGEPRRSSDRTARGQAGHDAHGLGRAAVEGVRAAEAHRVATAAGSNGTGTPANPGHAGGASRAGGAGHASSPAREVETSRVATSPAVGVFRPGPRAVVGTRVREGDTLGAVDVLGVPQEVVAPVDGLVGELLVEPGTAVEYGQELLIVALTTPAEAAR